jgi:hypothetical protein
MIGNWNADEQFAMSREVNLRNLCRKIEDEYITFARSPRKLSQDWPAIGELGRTSVKGVVLTFVCHVHYVIVQDPMGNKVGTVLRREGMAVELYKLAGVLEDSHIDR